MGGIDFSIVILTGILAGVGTVIGQLVTKLIKERTKTQKDLRWITAVCVVVAVVLATPLGKMLDLGAGSRKAMVANVVSEIKKNELFATIIKYHPEAQQELEGIFNRIAREGGKKAEMEAASMQAGLTVSQKYFDTDILNASDESVYGFIHSNYKVISLFANDPKACVSFAMGSYSPEYLRAVKENMAQLDTIYAAKSAVIESAFTAPQPFQPLSMEQTITLLTQSYQKLNVNPEEIAKLGNIPNLSPQEACYTSTLFIYVLASLPAAESSLLMKNLTKMGTDASVAAQ